MSGAEGNSDKLTDKPKKPTRSYNFRTLNYTSSGTPLTKRPWVFNGQLGEYIFLDEKESLDVDNTEKLTVTDSGKFDIA